MPRRACVRDYGYREPRATDATIRPSSPCSKQIVIRTLPVVTAARIAPVGCALRPHGLALSRCDDARVPRICEFYGIVIEMYFADHPPPHFHARYSGHEATIIIATGEMLAGELPGRALRLVREWRVEHRAELDANWLRARDHQAPERVAPLT